MKSNSSILNGFMMSVLFFLCSWEIWGQTKVIGYFPSYQWADISSVKYSKQYLQTLTHINLSFANPYIVNGIPVMDADGDYVLSFADNIDGSSKTINDSKIFIENVQSKFSAGNCSIKFFIAIGGANASKAPYKAVYETIFKTAANQTKFINGVIKLINKYTIDYGIQGIDIDFEGDLPYICKTTCNKQPNLSKLYNDIIVALVKKIHAKKKLVSLAVAYKYEYFTNTNTTYPESHSKDKFGLQVSDESLKNIDWINVMSYDYSYINDDYPLSSPPPNSSQKESHASQKLFERDFTYWSKRMGNVCQCSSNSKIVMGLPFYGKYAGNAGGEQSYLDIVNADPKNAKTDITKLCGACNNIYYNGVNTIKDKVAYAINNSCLGVMIWSVGSDYKILNENASLLEAIGKTTTSIAAQATKKVTNNLDPTIKKSKSNGFRHTTNADLYFIGIENISNQTYNGIISLRWASKKTGTIFDLILPKSVSITPYNVEYLDITTDLSSFPIGFYDLQVYADNALINSEMYEVVDENTGGVSGSNCHTIPGVQMTISRPNEMDFNEIALGSYGDEYLRITNPATSSGVLEGSLDIDPNHPEFDMQSTSNLFALQPGESQDFYVRYTPTGYGSVSVPIYIAHNASNYGCNYSINMTAYSTAPNISINETLNCSTAIALTCGVVHNGTTLGATNNVSHYGVNGSYFPITESGPEKVHTFRAGSTGTAHFVFSETASGSLDLYILNACSNMVNSIAHAGGGTNIRGDFDVLAGQTYYLVVDGENGTSGNYSLVVECPSGSSGGSNGGTTCATINKSSIDFGFIGSGSYGQQFFAISNPSNQNVQGWVRFVGQHSSYFGIWVPNVGYLTEYYYNLDPNQSISLEVMINASISASFSAQAKITFEGSCTTVPYYVDIKATNIPTLSWLTQFNGKSFEICYSPNNTIQWTSNALNPFADAAIEYSIDGGLNWLPYFYSPPNNTCGWGSGNNCVANDGEENFNSMGQYTRLGKMRIRYDCYDPNLPWIVSDGYFTVRDALNYAVNITYPNIQEVLTCGQNINITWAQGNVYSNGYKLYYSIDGGNTWTFITTTLGGNTSMNHSYLWTVPTIATTQLKFKVEDVDGATWGQDLSDYYNIIKCNVVPSIQVVQTINKPSCANATNGSITLSISGGIGGYICTWKKGSIIVGSSTSLLNINAGDYTYNIQDNSGASATGTVSLGSANFTIIPSYVQATCSKSDGSASVNISPNGSYNYLWSDNSTSTTISGKKSGTYDVIVTQTNTGCSQMEHIYIPKSSSPINLSIIGNSEVCQGNSTTLTANPTGGLAPYSYNWTNNATTPNRTVGAGSYWCIVTDANTCNAIKSLTISENSLSSAPLVSSATINNGQTAVLTVTGCDNGIVNWYNIATGGSSLGTGITYTTPMLSATRNYYASCTLNGCESALRGTGTVTINSNCQPSINHSGVITTGIYSASNTIISTGTIVTGTVYQAGKSITLLPGFSVGNNKTFLARIQNCASSIPSNGLVH